MGNMNPQLMKLIGKVESFCDRDLLDAELVAYIGTIKELDEVDLKDPTKWPWRNKENGYIETIRTLICHTPWVSPVATAVVLNDSMQILLEKRSDDKKWSIPGGIVFPGESVKECIIRDLARETGLCADLDNMRLFDELSGKAHYYQHGDILYSAKEIYVVKRCSGELRKNHENLDLAYFYLHDIPDNVSGSTKSIARSLISRFDEVATW